METNIKMKIIITGDHTVKMLAYFLMFFMHADYTHTHIHTHTHTHTHTWMFVYNSITSFF